MATFVSLQYLWGFTNIFGIASCFALLLAAVVQRRLPGLATIVGAFAAIAALWYALLVPRNDRNWQVDTSVLPEIVVEGDQLTLNGLRDFRWNSSTEFEAAWIDRDYDLGRLDSLDVLVVPFGTSEKAAHVMLSFGFSDGERLLISAEARKEVGEIYSLAAGALRQFELILVYATEEDAIDLRARHRGDLIYAYPVKAEAGFLRDLLLELCDTANDLLEKPQFYATLRRNCTTILLAHADRLLEQKIGFRHEILFPAKVGKLLHQLGLVQTDLDFKEAQKRFRIDERARAAAGKPAYSKAIRVREELSNLRN